MEVLGFSVGWARVPRVLDRENLSEDRGKPTIIMTQGTNQGWPSDRLNETV